MPSLWFVCPVAGRQQLAQICLRQLRRTCDSLTASGIEATAVVVGDDDNLDVARALGFGTVLRDNQFVSRKFNDGIQLACDPEVNSRPADFVMPIGSDDWIDWRIIRPEILPENDEIVGFQHISFVRGDGREITKTFLNVTGGCGMRIYPRALLAPVGYRPAEEDLYRACDTSILSRVRFANKNVKVMHVQVDPRQIVDWKTPGEQLNEYEQVLRRHSQRSDTANDPFGELEVFFPAEALDEMWAHYNPALVAA